MSHAVERYEEAIESFEKALEIETDHTAVLRNLAGVHLKLGNASAAVPLLRISAIRDPDTFESWYYLGGGTFPSSLCNRDPDTLESWHYLGGGAFHFSPCNRRPDTLESWYYLRGGAFHFSLCNRDPDTLESCFHLGGNSFLLSLCASAAVPLSIYLGNTLVASTRGKAL